MEREDLLPSPQETATGRYPEPEEDSSHLYLFKINFNIIPPHPNVSAEWLAFFIRIRDIQGSNVGPETGCCLKIFVIFLIPSRQMPSNALN
jgi:hypothetical protein